MAEKLSITIALSGAEEIKRQLAEVGKAGKDAFAEINDAAAEVGGFNKLDPSVVTDKMVKFGVAGTDAINSVNNAVKQAGRMETLVNALTSVENGLAGIKSAALATGEALASGLVRSLALVARLLPAAFAAATVGAIVSTTKSILELDAAAIKLGASIQDLSKAENIFKAIGLSAEEARKIVSGFMAEQAKIELAGVKEAAANFDEFGRSASTAKNWLKILEDGAKSANKEVADFAQQTLAGMGRVVPGISAAAKEIEKINQSALNAPEKIMAIIAVLEQMGPTAERNQIANKLFGPEFTQALNAGGVQLDLIKFKLASLPQPTKEAADAAVRLSLEWEKLKKTFSVEISPEALNAIADSIGQVRQGLEAVGAAVVAVNEAFIRWLSGNLFDNTLRELRTIGETLTWIGNLGVKIWDGIVQGAARAWGEIIDWINTAIARAKTFFSMRGSGGAAIPDAGGFARGGLMGGRGSGTSDSNLAWLSRGEHVMPAYAVRQPGVLQLLEALRRSGGNLRGVLDRMGHFALGGLVGAPAFAAGGINGMSHVTIQFPGCNRSAACAHRRRGGGRIAQGRRIGASTLGRAQAVAV